MRLPICLMLSLSVQAAGAIAQVGSATYTTFSSSTNVGPSASMNTTGATLLVCAIEEPTNAGTVSIADNKANYWNALAPAATSTYGNVFVFYSYAKNSGGSTALSTGTGHTFTGTGTYYPVMECSAWSGTVTSPSNPLDTSRAVVQNSTAASPFYTGSLTPSAANDLILSPCFGNGSNSSFTASPLTVLASGGSGNSGALAYQIQTSAVAVNAGWTWGGGSCAAASIAAFKVAPPAAPSQGGIF